VSDPSLRRTESHVPVVRFAGEPAGEEGLALEQVLVKQLVLLPPLIVLDLAEVSEIGVAGAQAPHDVVTRARRRTSGFGSSYPMSLSVR
jgi:hypothetical protein